MKRKTFIKNCGYACLSATTFGLLPSCISSKGVTGLVEGENLVIPISEFKTKQGSYHQYIVAKNPALRSPVGIFRISEEDYSALYLQCTHQGNEVNAYGDKLVCAAHGSEFDKKGIATKGPATRPLRSFQTQTVNETLLISLSKL